MATSRRGNLHVVAAGPDGSAGPDHGGSGPMPHVVVVGGGIAGLAAAWTVMRRSGGRVRITLLEGSDVLGGKLRISDVAGIPVDEGAESFLATRPEAILLARDAGLGEEMVEPEIFQGAIWSRGKPRLLPKAQIMGLPLDLRSLARSEILSVPGLLRLPLDHVMPPTPLDSDVAVGPYVAARLGREVVDRLIEPLLGGVYAGRADALSLEATLPAIFRAAKQDRSLLSAARHVHKGGATNAGARRGSAFRGIDGGVGRLAEAVARELRLGGVEIRTSATVRQLRRSPTGWRLTLGSTRAPERIEADAVILATPAAPTSRLLADVAPEASSLLSGIDYASVGIVTLAYRAEDITADLAGSGFLIPPVEGRSVKALTFASKKWGWLGRSAEEEGLVIIRASIGRQGEEEVLQRDDTELAELTHAELEYFVGARGKPVDSRVTRWGGALPQYAVGHNDRVTRVRAALADTPTLAVCGAAYEGVGIAAVVGTAQHAGANVMRTIASQRQWSYG